MAQVVTLVLMVLVLASGMTYAQQTFGNVRGTVKDESGAAIAGAKVTITDKKTSNSFTTQSREDGFYQFNNLSVGEYEITVESSGFKTLSLTGVLVNLNQTTDVPTTLTVGTAGETIEVSAGGTELVETSTTTLAKGFDARQTVDLAQTSANGGVYNLALIAANVSSSGGVGLGTGGSVGGQRPRNNNFQVDGIDNNDKSVTGPQIYISPETVSEFSLLSNQFSAEFGRSNGGQFITVTRSGSNEFHGTAYEYLRNRNLNALDTLQKIAGVVREKSQLDANHNSLIPRADNNRFGGNVGGPILKNKLFFFVSYEHQAIGNASAPGGLTAPTAAGFATLGTIPGLSATNLGVFRQFVPVAPANDAGTIQVTSGTRTFNIPIGNIFFDAPNFSNQRNFVLNLDYTQSEKTQHHSRFIFNRIRSIDNAANLPVFFTDIPQDGRLFSYTFLHSFTPSLTIESRISYRRNVQLFPVPNISYPGLDAFPNITLDDLSINIGPDPNAPQSGIENNYQLVQNLSYTKGNHSMKFGLDTRRLISPQRFVQRERGDYEYSTTDLFLRDITPDVLGERNAGGNTYYGNQWLLYLFAQDDWRIRSNLTLNLGLRYEFQQVPASARLQSLNSAASVPGLIEFREPKAQKANFAPKIGLAYAPAFEKGWRHTIFGSGGESSIRAGFSLGYDYIFDNLYILSNPPQFQKTVDVDLNSGAPNFLKNGGIPGGASSTPVTDPAALRKITASFIPDQKVPYSLTYTLSYQRQFLKDWSVELRYLGTRGIHLLTQNRINRIIKVSDTTFLPTFTHTPTATELAGLSLNLGNLKALPSFNQFGQAGFNGSNLVAFLSNGNSTYNAFSVSLTRRFTKGLSLNAAYTYSHLIDDTTAEVFSTVLSPRRVQDFQNLRAERSDSALDRRNRFVVSGLYELPYFTHSSNWATRTFLGGFSFAGTLTFEAGEKATVLSGTDSNLNGDAAGDRTIRNPNGVKNTGSGVIAIDKNGRPVALNNNLTVAYIAKDPNAEYIQAGPGARATSGRNTLPLPGISNLDFSIFKNFQVYENIKMQFRADLFNAFNHAQYIPGSPNGVNPISTTGVSDVNTVGRTDFNNPSRVFSGNPRVIQLALRLNF